MAFAACNRLGGALRRAVAMEGSVMRVVAILVIGLALRAGAARAEQAPQDGRCAQTDDDGRRHHGDFADGTRHGNGVYVYPSGNRYEGEFRNGSRHGKGVMVFKNGDRYDGDWKEGQRTGQGVFTWSDGDRYEGE